MALPAIAGFYLVPDLRLADVLAAATPISGGWFRPPRDTFWEILRASSRQLDPFTAGSGWVFNTLDLYLEDRHRLTYSAFGDATIGDLLSRARGSYWLAIPPSAAARLLGALEPLAPGLDDLIAFITSEHGGDHAAEEAAAVQAALTTLKGWAREVSPGTTGLLSVG
jgi:hypothetical protein